MKRLADRELHFGEDSAQLRESEELRERLKARIEDLLALFDSLKLG